MLKLFISYRRADTRKDAGRLYDRLSRAFGRDNVFKDVDDIPFGMDFRQVLSDAVAQCDVVLVLMGQHWIDITNQDGIRRLENPNDFVRIEVESALARKDCMVVPVLLDGAKMPTANQLPESLRPLAFRHALVIRDDPDFHRDVDRLLKGLAQRFGKVRGKLPTTGQLKERRATFNVQKAVLKYYEAYDNAQWETARAILAAIRESGQAPRTFNVDEAERAVWQALERGEADREYELIRIMFQRDTPERVWDALQALWKDFPGYDPDDIAAQVRVAAQEPEAPAEISAADLLPAPFEWCNIPAGKVEIKGQWFTLYGFRMAKYPVTHAHYQVFLEADDGYADTAWWDYSRHAQTWRAESSPRSSTYNDEDMPRTNVSWFDAMAFCRWLSARTGKQIVLPTEAQWQWAASGHQHLTYPYDAQFCEDYVNTAETERNRPTPVTMFPRGASPYGVMDMSGNVWEWCSNEVSSPNTPRDNGDAPRLMRGGSFADYKFSSRCTCREWEIPSHWDANLSFRVVSLD